MIACGSKIAGFEVLGKLGQGGMGAVFKARQRSLDRLVAVKVLPEKFAADREFVGRFLREARATARLNHPNIVTGIEVGSDRGWHFFAMEYVEGESLGGRIKRLGKVAEAEALDIGHAMALALAHAHAHGILHRDVKPDNILLDRHGIPKLTDLGLAKPQGGGEGSLTQTGMVVGSPHYISPEQARGEKRLDGRADIYSLGCTLYHAATGVVPFDDRSVPVILVKHLQERMPHPQAHRPELSDGFCELLARMVARDPAGRYTNMDRVARDIGRLLDGQPPASRGHAARQAFLPVPAGRAIGRAPSNGLVRPARRKQHPCTERTLAGRREWNRLGLIAAGVCAALLPILAVALARNPERPSSAAASPHALQASSPATKAPALQKEEAKPVAAPSEPRVAPSAQAPPPPFPLPGFGPFTALFNGRDLDGWKVVDEAWRVDGGVLVGRGSHGNAWIVSHDKLPPQMDLLIAAEWEGTSMVSLDWPAGAIIVLLQPDGRVEAKRYADKQSVLIASAAERMSAGPHVCRLNLRSEELRIFGDGRLLLTVPVDVRDADGPKVGLFAARGKPFRIQRLDVIGSSALAAE